MTDLPPPTFDLKPLADRLGLDGLLCLLEKRGGTRLQIPQSTQRSQLAGELGEAVAAALIDAYGGTRLKVPLGREWRVQVYHARGWSYAQIAVALGLTEDGVWRSLRTAALTARRAPPTAPASPSAQFDLISWIDGRS